MLWKGYLLKDLVKVLKMSLSLLLDVSDCFVIILIIIFVILVIHIFLSSFKRLYIHHLYLLIGFSGSILSVLIDFLSSTLILFL